MRRWLLGISLLLLLAACTPEDRDRIGTQVAGWLTATPEGGGPPPWLITPTREPQPPTALPPATASIPVPSQTALPPTQPPYPYPPVDTPTPIGGCYWHTDYDPVTPEFDAALNSTFAASFTGSIYARIYGERNVCGGFYPWALEVDAAINVANLDQATLLAADAQFTAMMEGLQPWPAPQLGPDITFYAPNGVCDWIYGLKQCSEMPTPTHEPAPPTVTPTPTPSGCSWYTAYEPVTPEFAAALSAAFNSQFTGSISAQLFGERSTCQPFFPWALEVDASINVGDLDQATLLAADAQFTTMMEGLQPWPAPLLGEVEITFFGSNTLCQWNYVTKVCSFLDEGMLTPPPVFTPTPAVEGMLTPTPTLACDFNWQPAVQPLTREFAATLEQAFSAVLSGAISGQVWGQLDGCNTFHPEALEVSAMIEQSDFDDASLLASDAAFTQTLNSIQPWPAPQLGQVDIIFTGITQCAWNYAAKSCQFLDDGMLPTPTP